MCVQQELIVSATVLQQPWTVECPSELGELGDTGCTQLDLSGSSALHGHSANRTFETN